MVLIQCVNAYTAMQALMNREMDYQTAYAVVALKRELKDAVAFYREEEYKLVETYAARDDKGQIIRKSDGRFVLQDPMAAEEYSKKRQALGMVEVQKEFTRMRVPEPERIEPAILEALEGFLVFGGEESE
jgi:hypothetical protein